MRGKNVKQNILIGLGVLLILVGVAGAMLDLYQTPAAKIYGMYIGPMKQFSQQATIAPTPVISSTETVSPEPSTTPLPDPFSQFGPRSFYVHPGTDLQIENPAIPDRIVITAINLDAPVVPADYNFTKVDGETFGQWQAPSMYAAGWHPDSALLGKRGNTVINGHHNEFGEVFGKLVDVKVGDIVEVYSRGEKFSFVIANYMILPERFQPVSVRLENARWINSTDDVRLTLVTCWPKSSNTHRLILVARPIAYN